MNKQPTVSIILPTYNRAYLLEKCIESVLQQTFEDFELLIIDDGSTDDTESVVKNIHDHRVKYIKCTKNEGVSHARNIGIKKARGEYIAFQDSDTEWYSNKLEEHMKVFNTVSSEVGIVYAGRYKLKPNNDMQYNPKYQKYTNEENLLLVFLVNCFIGPVATCIKKSCFDKVGGFDESLSTSEDCELWIRLSKEYKFKFIDKPLHLSHSTEGSLSSEANIENRLKANDLILEKHKNLYDKNKELLARRYITLYNHSLACNCSQKSRNYLFKSIQANPTGFKSYIYLLRYIIGNKFHVILLKIYRKIKYISRRFICLIKGIYKSH